MNPDRQPDIDILLSFNISNTIDVIMVIYETCRQTCTPYTKYHGAIAYRYISKRLDNIKRALPNDA